MVVSTDLVLQQKQLMTKKQNGVEMRHPITLLNIAFYRSTIIIPSSDST